MSASVKVEDNLDSLYKAIERDAKEAFNTVATDIQKVSSDAAPHLTGFLEKNHLNIDYGSSAWVATIGFIAYNGNFDYAEWTHNATYNLGEGSRSKPGGSSKFTGHVKVGRQYANRTVEQGRAAYINHIYEKIKQGLE